MQRCPELSQLTKCHGVKSVRFKRTTPGSIGQLGNANKPPPKHRVLDPSHPALDFTPAQFAKAFPWRTYPGFAMRAIPKGLLEKPPVLFPDPPFTFAPVRSASARDGDGEGSGQRKDGPVSMSLMNLSSKGTGGRVLKVNVSNKFKTAVSLVVARSANVAKDKNGQVRIVFGEEPTTRDQWVLSDWTYLCRPSMEINRMPFHALIPSLRSALRDIVLRGRLLEQQWYGQSVDQSQKAPEKHARKRVARKQVIPKPVAPIKQDAAVEQLLDVIRTAPAYQEDEELGTELEHLPDEMAGASPQALPSSPGASPAQDSGSQTRERVSSPALDAMLNRMRSRLPSSSRAQNASLMANQANAMPSNAPVSRLRADGRPSPLLSRGPATKARS